MKRIIYASIVSLFASVNLVVNNTWQAGLSLTSSSIVFRILNELVQPFTNINLLFFLLFFFAVFSLSKYIDRNKEFIRISWIAKLLSGLYAIILSVCIDYDILDSTNSTNLYLYSSLRLCVLLLSIVGMGLVFYLVIEALTLLVGMNTEKIGVSKKNTTNFSYLKYFIVMLACWLPYIIILYPGTRNPDTINQLLEFFNHGDWVRDDYPIGWYLLGRNPFTISNQHNFFVTLLYGTNFKLGLNVFHSAGIGLFISTCLQVVLMVSVLIYALLTFSRMRMPKKVINVFTAFFALFPMLPIICVFLTKNILYASAILWSILLVVNALYDNEYFERWQWWSLFILSLVFQLMTEKYAIYIIIFTAILILALWIKEKLGIKLSLTMIGTSLLFLIFQSGLFNALNVPSGDPIEGQAVMIQSTALYVKEFPKDLTKQDKKTLNRVFVLKNLPKLYTPGISDPVKSSGLKKIGLKEDNSFDQHLRKNWIEGYRYRTVTKQELNNYKKTWLRLAMRHPEVVFVAFMNQGYKYLSLTNTQETCVNGWNTPYDSFNVAQTSTKIIIDHKPVIIDYTSHFVRIREMLTVVFNVFDKIPPFSLVLNGNIYICISILIFLVLLGLKYYKESIVVFSFILQAPIFMLSPVNGSQRYMYSFFFAGGILVGLAYCWLHNHRNNSRIENFNKGNR